MVSYGEQVNCAHIAVCARCVSFYIDMCSYTKGIDSCGIKEINSANILSDSKLKYTLIMQLCKAVWERLK